VPIVDGDRVYAPSSDGALYALDATTGMELWHFTTVGEDESSPTLADGVIYLGSGNQNLYAIDATSGTALWQLALDGPVAKGPSVSNGVAYIGTRSGSIYAIGSGQAGASAQPTLSASSMSTVEPSAATTNP